MKYSISSSYIKFNIISTLDEIYFVFVFILLKGLSAHMKCIPHINSKEKKKRDYTINSN